MADRAERQKVAVLGGGVGGMVTAFWLTSTDQLREAYDVTVYQSGWRLGGKGASGRDLAHGGRIEEHGLHIWFGFYDNAFFTMRQCYEELVARHLRAATCPIPDFAGAFAPSPTIGLFEHYDGTWLSHAYEPPHRVSPVHPELGTIGPTPSLWHVLSSGIVWAMDAWGALRTRLQVTGHGFPKLPLQRFLHWSGHFEVDLDEFDAGVKEKLLGAVQDLGADLGDLGGRVHVAEAMGHALQELIVRPLVAFKRELWEQFVKHRVDDAELRFFFTTFDTFLTAVVGILDADVVTNGFTSIDGLELSEFLRAHGAEDFTLGLEHSPFLRGWYDAAFAYRFVNGTAVPDLAAGTGVHGILRLIGGYRGYVAYKMRAGMGDTIFGPFYEVLRDRGVRFEFFREVTDLELSADRSTVDGIRVVHQAEVVAGATYEPLVDVADLPCWPSEPCWDQLVDGAALRAADTAFEHGGRAPGAVEQVLAHGEDFDLVVLAIPAPALGGICGQVADQVPAFRAMLDNCRSVMTQAGQMWTTTPLDQLGARFGGTAIATSFVEPIDTYCDMSHLLDRESWGDHPPLGVAYFCGVMPDQASQAAADTEVARAVHDLLRDHATELWPRAVRPDGSFDWSVLFDPAGGDDAARFAAQYLRANFEPTERYVLSTAGSTVHRLREDALVEAARTGRSGPGVTNLYLAGDWTLNGINGGCVEAATMSGMRASRSICGTPSSICAENVDWLTRVEQ
jgi:uncharacterized protein with NAD-binding domain and iron-sulfur cluster